eukprot:m.77962 g.77962  ORF g.77962 m.77962 type:complete len:81 (-) comp12649_c0_seq3:148-390(-)
MSRSGNGSESMLLREILLFVADCFISFKILLRWLSGISCIPQTRLAVALGAWHAATTMITKTAECLYMVSYHESILCLKS